MTPLNLEAGVKGQIQHLGKIPRPNDILQIVFTSQTPRSNGKGDIRPFNRITTFDIKHENMAAILFCKLGQNYYQTSFPNHIFLCNLMKLPVIFQDLEHLYDFNWLWRPFCFSENEAKIFDRHVFIAINIPSKFGEDIFLNEWDIKVHVKNVTNRRTDRRMHALTYGRHFIISWPWPSATGGR